MGIADLNHCQSMLKRKTREVEQLKDQLAQLKNTGSWVKNFLVTVPASIYVMDKTGSICLACSDLQAKALGYRFSGDIVGKSLFDLFPEEEAKIILENNLLVMKMGQEYPFEELATLADGQKKSAFLSKKVPMYDAKNQQVVGLLGVSLDITAHKQAEQLKKEKEIVEATNKRLKAVAGSIAHQVTNPLASVKMAAAFIDETMQKLIDAYHKSVQLGNIQSNISDDDLLLTQQLSTQINYLITQTGHIIHHHLINIKHNSWHTQTDWALCGSLSVTAMIKKALADYPFTEQQKQLIHWQAGEDFNVLGIEDLLLHVISNLLSNALDSIKQANKGGISIWIQKESTFNYLHIKDTGIGLAREGRKNIFKAFYSDSGAGLGLYFCESVMRGYGGNITCRGQKGQFAQFTLQFLKSSDASKKYHKKIKLN